MADLSWMKAASRPSTTPTLMGCTRGSHRPPRSPTGPRRHRGDRSGRVPARPAAARPPRSRSSSLHPRSPQPKPPKSPPPKSPPSKPPPSKPASPASPTSPPAPSRRLRPGRPHRHRSRSRCRRRHPRWPNPRRPRPVSRGTSIPGPGPLRRRRSVPWSRANASRPAWRCEPATWDRHRRSPGRHLRGQLLQDRGSLLRRQLGERLLVRPLDVVRRRGAEHVPVSLDRLLIIHAAMVRRAAGVLRKTLRPVSGFADRPRGAGVSPGTKCRSAAVLPAAGSMLAAARPAWPSPEPRPHWRPAASPSRRAAQA